MSKPVSAALMAAFAVMATSPAALAQTAPAPQVVFTASANADGSADLCTYVMLTPEGPVADASLGRGETKVTKIGTKTAFISKSAVYTDVHGVLTGTLAGGTAPITPATRKLVARLKARATAVCHAGINGTSDSPNDIAALLEVAHDRYAVAVAAIATHTLPVNDPSQFQHPTLVP